LTLALVRRDGLIAEGAKNPEQMTKKCIVYQSFRPRYWVIEAGFATSEGTKVLMFWWRDVEVLWYSTIPMEEVLNCQISGK
jgi:hypothetical protein